MGKKSKQVNQVKQGSNISVSIITVTQLKRHNTICITADLINDQTYENIIQWVIVEGSKNISDAKENEQKIEVLRKICKVKIDYIPYTGEHLGQLRNLGNQRCDGDITVCMDDDDYYPPTRVEHAVKMLKNSKYLIAGCSGKYLYDYTLKKFICFKQYAPYHSTNDCMAWKKEYLLSNKHDPLKDNAEESSFTKEFKNEMVQLDPKHSIVQSSHNMNTFDKKEIVLLSSIGIYPLGTAVNDNVTSYIPKKYYERYLKLFDTDIPKKVCEYDIVYFTGKTSIEWNPTDGSLGGSEQAIVNITKEWVRFGKKVIVYGNVPNCELHGVDYREWKEFDYSAIYKVIILWRHAGVNGLLHIPVKAEKLYVDLHDNFYTFRFDYERYSNRIDKIFFKSNFHLECYQKFFKESLPKDKYSIILNGIRMSDFSKKPSGVIRNPYRFCYCSCYTRGLQEILEHLWPIIFHNQPLAELHVYYGMNGVSDEEFKAKMLRLLSQPGVMDHSRQPMDIIIREKWTSTFHLYPTDCDGEIDCISIRESLLTGCIPILSNLGVFKERHGLHFELNKSDPESYKNIAKTLLYIMSEKPEILENARNELLESDTILNWNEVANEWLKFV